MSSLTCLAASALVLAAPMALADDVFLTADEAKALVGKDGVRFVFADGAKDYEKGHIAGSSVAFAHDLQLLDDVKTCQGLPMCEAAAYDFIGKLGVDDKTQVVVYDAGMGVNASGTWFFLKLYGHPNARILEGGLATWKAKGGAVETGAPPKLAAKAFKGSVKAEMIATRDEVLAATKDPAKYLIVDARHTLDEYTGKTLQSSLSSPGKEFTVARGGAIPGAVFSPWTKYAGNKNAEPDKPTLKADKDLAKQLEKLKKNGYAPEKTVISYCHVGLGRGTFQYLALQRAGHKSTKVYVGSWAEWAQDPSLPLNAVAAAGE